MYAGLLAMVTQLVQAKPTLRREWRESRCEEIEESDSFPQVRYEALCQPFQTTSH